ncbi:hypothetical protein GCM10007385_03060 [Tateyamaria omphalii]|uniref:hypothetical protein n=1 Tax=Tateyamaria omphalii TaxID=299262 RepID=UPI001678EE4E|nr:hypothetical protein [Tateyamaria omphalii]GGX39434.1 hypothetical protein GCM10007385_03060 [Tateyamaria omphalii]
MNVGQATIDTQPFDAGFLGMGGFVPAPSPASPDFLAAKALHAQTNWVIYEYDCRTQSEKRRRIDASGRLALDPILVIYGKGTASQRPSKKSIVETYKALAKAVGVQSPPDLDKAFGKALGLDRIPVPWAEIQKNHNRHQLYDVTVDPVMAAYRLTIQGTQLPGDVFLLVPMSASFHSATWGFCLESGKFEYYLGRVGYYDSVRVNLSGPSGRQLQREEAKRRVQIIEKHIKELREFGTYDGSDVEEQIKELHRQIDELIKY